MEDINQVEIRRRDFHMIKGPIKFFALYNAYCVKPDKDTLFFNPAPYFHYYFDEVFPQFSTDFSSIVYGGSTIIYQMLQLAYHLGFSKVYLIGVDFSWPEEFLKLKKKGERFYSLRITSDNIHIVKKCHENSNYYSVGDTIGIPWMEGHIASYKISKKYFENDNRSIFNAGVNSKLDVFPKVDYNSLF